MKILVYGSEKFADYATFMRGVVVAMDQPGMDRLEILSAGPHKINAYSAEFVNRSEGFLRQKGVRPSFRRIRYADVAQDFDNYNIDAVLYFSTKNEANKPFDTVLSSAEEQKIPVSIYRL